VSNEKYIVWPARPELSDVIQGCDGLLPMATTELYRGWKIESSPAGTLFCPSAPTVVSHCWSAWPLGKGIDDPLSVVSMMPPMAVWLKMPPLLEPILSRVKLARFEPVAPQSAGGL